MAKPLVDDDLWLLIEPLLPKPKRRRRHHPGRNPMDPRAVLAGIIFVLKTGIPWEDLPQELGCGSGMTCWRYLRKWQRAGVWRKLHQVLLNRLNAADKIDWSRAVVDSAAVRAFGGAAKPGPTPQTAQKPARNTTCSPMARAIRSPSRSPEPIGTM